jgi:hypothetical protein
VTGTCECGCPTVDLEVDRERTPRAKLASEVPVEALSVSESPDEAGGLILFTEDGWLSMLELWFTSDEPPGEFPPPLAFQAPRKLPSD